MLAPFGTFLDLGLCWYSGGAHPNAAGKRVPPVEPFRQLYKIAPAGATRVLLQLVSTGSVHTVLMHTIRHSSIVH